MNKFFPILFYGLFLFNKPLYAQFKTGKLEIAMGYSSHEICSCVFIEKRLFSECETDYGVQHPSIKINLDQENKVVMSKYFNPKTGVLILKRWARFINNSCILDELPVP